MENCEFETWYTYGAWVDGNTSNKEDGIMVSTTVDCFPVESEDMSVGEGFVAAEAIVTEQGFVFAVPHIHGESNFSNSFCEAVSCALGISATYAKEKHPEITLDFAPVIDATAIKDQSPVG